MPNTNFNRLMKSLALNAQSRKTSVNIGAGGGITALNWEPANYRYAATNAGGGSVNGSSAQIFGEEIILGGTGKGMLTLRGPDNTKRVSLAVQDAHDEQQTYQLPLDFPSSSGYALVSTDAGIMSWAAFSGGNSYITALTWDTPNSRYKATLSDASIVTGTALTSFGPYIKLSGTNAGQVDLYEAAANGSAHVSLRGPTDMGTNPSYPIILPVADGTTGQALRRASQGQLEWYTTTDANNYVDSLGFNTGDGVLTLGRTSPLADLTVDLDGRYVLPTALAGAANYLGYFTGTNALTGTAGFQYDGTDIDTVGADMTMTSSTTLKPVLTLENTNVDATAAYLNFYRNEANTPWMQDGDVLGTIQFSGKQVISGVANKVYADIRGVFDSDSGGNNPKSSIRFRTRGNSWGAYKDPLTLLEDNVGINQTTPTYNLEVIGSTKLSGAATVTGIATLGDGSTLATSAAPTADAQIANKKYVDDNTGTGTVTGGGADNYVAHWTSATNVTGTSGFQYDDTDLTLASATASKPVFNINNTNDDANAGELQFYKSSDSVAVNDNIGKLSFYFDNNHTTPQKTLGAKIYSTVQSGADGAEGGYLYFSTMKAGTEVVTMTLKSGNVGFGPNSPGYHYVFSKHASADTNILIQGNDADWLWQNKNSDGSLLWKQNTDGVSAMTLTSGGNLGIGTTNPLHPLSVYGSTADWVTELHQTNTTAGQSWGVQVQGGTNSSDMTFQAASAAGTNYFNILGDGKVGIGVDSPSDDIEMAGVLKVYTNGTGNSNDYARLGNLNDMPQLKMVKNDTVNVQITTDGDTFFNGGDVSIGTTSVLGNGRLSIVNSGQPQLTVSSDGTNYSTIEQAAGTAGSLYILNHTTGDIILDSNDDIWLYSKWNRFYNEATATEFGRIAHDQSWLTEKLDIKDSAGNVDIRLETDGGNSYYNAAGNFGFGTTSPATTLHVAVSGSSMGANKAISVGAAGDTGMYAYNASQLRFAVGDVDKLRITTEGCQFGSDGSWSPSIRVGTGSANAPSVTNIAFRPLADDSDTGYTRSAANTLALVAGGTEIMSATSTAVNVTGTLGVSGLITASGGLTLPATSDNFTMGGNAVNDILIGTDSYPGSDQDDYLITAKYLNAVSGTITAAAGGGTIAGTVADTFIPIANATDTVESFVKGLAENNSIWIGSDPSSSSDAANYNTALGTTALDAIVRGDNNTAIGSSALSKLTDADDNVAVGYQASNENTTGNSNVSVGRQALYSNITGTYNVALGDQALVYAGDGTASPTGSIAIGYQAGRYPEGNYNTWVGYSAGRGASATRTSNLNTAIGREAMSNTQSDTENVAIGAGALELTTGSHLNVAIGRGCMNSTVGANRNVAIGYYALEQFVGSTSNTYNTAVGFYAMKQTSAGTNNVAIGGESMYGVSGNTNSDNVAVGMATLYSAAGASQNVAVGHKALYDLTEGDKNVAIGYLALSGATTAHSNVAIGYQALDSATLGSENVAIGTYAGQAYVGNAGTTGAFGVFIGHTAGYLVTGNGSYKSITLVGHAAGYGATGAQTSTGIGASALYYADGALNTTAVGRKAGYKDTGTGSVWVGDSAGHEINGNYNVALGYGALSGASSGTGFGTATLNVAIGRDAMANVTSANNSVVIGYEAGAAIVAGNDNTLLGYKAGKAINGGTGRNVMVGSQAGQSATTTDASTIIGWQAAGGAALTGDYNTAVGYQSGYALVGAVEGNVLLGHRAGFGATSGGYNTFLGYAAGQNVTTGAGNVVIGKNAGPSSTNTDSDKLYIHNAAGTPLIGGDFSAGTVTIDGTLSATAKSFNIAHPLYKDKRLVHGSLEGPEHGIYIRGSIESKEYGCLIELPEYWDAMCEDYTVQLTPHGPYTVYIKEKQKDKVMIACTSKDYKFDYYVVGSRTDETLEVVQDG